MLKRVFFAITLVILFTSCSAERAEQSFVDIRAVYLAGDVSLCADISADYGDRRCEYSVRYTGDGKSGEISVLQPEEICGISAKISDNGSVTLKCDDVLLDTGLIYGAGISPMEAVPLIVNAVREGYVVAVYTEKVGDSEYIAAEINATAAGETVETIYTVWFSAEDKMLRKAEIMADGYSAITVTFKEVQE